MKKLKHRLLTIIFLFTTIFFFANGQEVKALSCAEKKGSLQEELDGYTGAVYGEIKKIKVDLKQEGITGTKEKVRYILVEVERSWKTEVDSQVIVATDYTWGFNFKEGSKYFIFISEMDGELSSSPCSTTIEMNNLNQATKQFGEGLEPKQQVNLESKMWFMMEQDFDLYIVLAIILVVSAGFIMRARKKRKRG